MRSLVRHRACGVTIFTVDRALTPGAEIVASEWHPVDKSWPEPVSGGVMRCPSCGELIHPNEHSLEVVEAGP